MSERSDLLFRYSACWKITRKDGNILYFTDHDNPIKLQDGQLYHPSGGIISSASQGQQGLKANNVEFKGMIDSDNIDFDDLRAGKYREAEIVEYIVDWLFPTNPPIETKRFWISETTFNGQFWVAQIAGQSMWLTRPVGRVYARECDADLGDTRCGVDLTSFTVTGTVVSIGVQRKSFVSDVTTGADGDYNDSNITWLTGLNHDEKTQVKAYLADGSFSVQLFTPRNITVGDTFSVYRTCDKSYATCDTVFGNTVNFRGFPFMPGTDRYLQTPNPK